MGHSPTLLMGYALSLSACMSQAEAVQTDSAQTDSADARVDKELRAQPVGLAVELDVRRSLVVTEQPIVARFTFERVMNQLASQARIRGLSATSLFQQWWDTQNPTALATTSGPHCDSSVDATFGPLINGFPYSCRPAPAEGAQATCNPFNDATCSYIPIGLFNRFDLAAADGSSCGEYRIVFAKTSGSTNLRNRNLLIFEASMPNPAPKRGLEGCRSIVSFWADLSRISKLEDRARKLEQFYFQGLGSGTPPVVDIRNYGDNPSGRGQIRTNQFVQDGLEARAWSLREFKLHKRCSTGGATACSASSQTLNFVPVTNKTNPYGLLFSETSTYTKQAAFKDVFVEQVGSLAANQLMAISMNIPDEFNSAQSQASGSTETNYWTNFEDGGSFADRLLDRIEEAGLDLEPVDIVARAQTQTCAGCHRISNRVDLGGGLTWPASLGFTHITETEPETVDGIVRFRISEALATTFLPHRKNVMSEFLAGRGGKQDRKAQQHSH